MICTCVACKVTVLAVDLDRTNAKEIPCPKCGVWFHPIRANFFESGQKQDKKDPEPEPSIFDQAVKDATPSNINEISNLEIPYSEGKLYKRMTIWRKKDL